MNDFSGWFRAPEEHAESGQVLYEAVIRARGAWAPRWEELSEQEQDAWRAGAHEVFQKCWLNAARVPRHGRN